MHPEADQEGRRVFAETILAYRKECRTIVYLDESGFAYDMPRTHGYAPIGERCHGIQDWHAKGRVNAIGAIIDFQFLTVCLFDANVDSEIFFAWLTKDLIPKLPPESVVVMDNATFHKRSDMQDVLTTAGHTLLYLPPYSPDFNPIEHKWAEVKAKRRERRCSAQEVFSHVSYYDRLG